jgi:hypothetical protein
MPATLDGSALMAWLTGRWSVARDINDGAGAFHGEATFSPEADGTLRWHEAGEMTLGGATLPARRTLFLGADGRVAFDDGRPFHDLALVGGACDAFHPCGPDEYRGRYEAEGEDAFVVTWRVTGPGRDDTIRSRYTRLG